MASFGKRTLVHEILHNHCADFISENSDVLEKAFNSKQTRQILKISNEPSMGALPEIARIIFLLSP
jgi:hypothetical protein